MRYKAKPQYFTQKKHKIREIRALVRPIHSDNAILYGYHAVLEALRSERRKALTLYAVPAALEKIAACLGGKATLEKRLDLRETTVEDLNKRLGGAAVHQGVLLEVHPLPIFDISEIENKSGIVLALDQITDPHNVGAIIRTAAAFSVDGLIITKRHAPDFSGALAKAASGGLEHISIIEVTNLSRALEELGEMNYLRIGLDSQGEKTLDSASINQPTALVLGAEGSGLRRLTREHCDIIARLDMPGAIKSLNVSNACTLALSLVRQSLSIQKSLRPE